MRYLLLLLALTACAVEREVGPVLTRADTILVQAGMPAIGKLKAHTVIIQTGQGNSANVADNRKSGQRQGSAANAPASTAGNASKRSSGPAWWVYIVAGCSLLVAGAAGWEWLSHRGLLAWLPWRARPG